MTKSATIPFLWIDPELRQAAEDVLQDGESLTVVVEQALLALISSRSDRAAFLTRQVAAEAGGSEPASHGGAERDERALPATARLQP